jgi:hypothetical protein
MEEERDAPFWTRNKESPWEKALAQVLCLTRLQLLLRSPTQERSHFLSRHSRIVLDRLPIS